MKHSHLNESGKVIYYYRKSFRLEGISVPFQMLDLGTQSFKCSGAVVWKYR